MSERTLFPSAELEDDSDTSVETSTDKKKNKKKKKSNTATRLASPLIERELPKVEARKPKEENLKSDLDKLLADLAIEKPDKTAEKEKAEEVLTTPSLAETNERFRQWRELEPNEISSGEGVIEFDGDVTVEGEVNLRTHEANDIVAVHEYDLALNSNEGFSNVSSDAGEANYSVYDHIPEQPTPPPTAAGSGSGRSGGGLPPIGGGPGGPSNPSNPNTPGGPNLPPNTPNNPIFNYASSSSSSNPNTIPVSNNPNQNVAPLPPNPGSLQNILNARIGAERAVARHGNAANALLWFLMGGGIEHARHKSRERKMAKKFAREQAKQDEKISNLTSEQHLLKTEQLEQSRQAERSRRQAADEVRAETAATAKAQFAEVAASRRAQAAEADNNRLRISEAAAIKNASQLEKHRIEDEKAKAEQIERLNASALKQEQLAEKITADENRIETSAWHAIEVDKHGKAVQESSIEYGHEYFRERAAETGPRDKQLDTKAGSAALTALAASSSSTSMSYQDDIELPPMLGMSQAAKAKADKHGAGEVDGDGKPSSAGGSLLLWIIALAILVILIAVLS